MQNKLIITLLLALFPVLAWAEPPAVRADHPETYTVVKGDTLWDISGRFLEQPWRWPDIWEANPQIENPHLIYPGDMIRLTYRDGRPILFVVRGEVVHPDAARYLKLSPEMRIHERDEPIPTIPIDGIRPFLTQPLVVAEGEMQAWPYVVSGEGRRMIAGAGHKIYVRGLPEQHGSRFSIYRMGPAYKVPGDDERYQDGEVLGYEALYVGEARIEQDGDPARAVITRSQREILIGDRLLPHSEIDIMGDYIPRPPAADVRGNVISVIDGVSEIGQYQVVVLSVGAADGIQDGAVLGVFQSGQMVRDTIAARQREKAGEEQRLVFEHEQDSQVDSLMSNIFNDVRQTKRAFDRHMDYFGRPQSAAEMVELPEEFSGVVMVFRTFDKVSYALVMETDAPIHLNDTVCNL